MNCSRRSHGALRNRQAARRIGIYADYDYGALLRGDANVNYTLGERDDKIPYRLLATLDRDRYPSLRLVAGDAHGALKGPLGLAPRSLISDRAFQLIFIAITAIAIGFGFEPVPPEESEHGGVVVDVVGGSKSYETTRQVNSSVGVRNTANHKTHGQGCSPSL